VLLFSPARLRAPVEVLPSLVASQSGQHRRPVARGGFRRLPVRVRLAGGLPGCRWPAAL